MESMSVELERVNFTYPGSPAGVHDVSLRIGDGEIVVVIGPSGCGKTTLLSMIAGFLKPASGRVLVDGVDVTGVPPRSRNVGVVFQSYALFPHMQVWENVAYPLKVRGIPLAERRRKAEEVLALVGLPAMAERRPASLSGGQQQRVALARALAFVPKALLLDEPMSALDAALRTELRDEIRRLQRLQGVPTLHITHDQEEALTLADRVAVMQQGRIVQVATPEELYDRPLTREIAEFVGHANIWPGVATGPDTVRTSIGDLRTTAHGRPLGSAVQVLVRPERIVVGAAADSANTFACRVLLDRFAGPVRRYDVEVPGGMILGQTGERGPIERVQIPPAHIHLLPETQA
jgi:putative spermidine/putrescine transport system ATP-binding protein